MLPDLDQICESVEIEWGAGGLTDGFYDQYAKDVAIKYARLILEELIDKKQNIQEVIKSLKPRSQ